MAGLLIVFEGIDGCGKTTQLRIAHERLQGLRVLCVTARDPGSTPGGEAVRQFLLDPGRPELSAAAELGLFCAARAELVQRVIEPAIAEGQTVLCDRFGASSVAYQGHAGGAGVELAEQMVELATNGRTPDVTFILDLEPELAAVRMVKLRPDESADRIERRSLQFQERVREGYLLYAQRHAERCVVIDGAQSTENVAAEVWERMRRLGLGVEENT